MVPLILITGVGSILATWLLPVALNSEPPYGVVADILVGTLLGLVWAVIGYQVISPAIGLENPLKLVLSAGDAIGLAAVMLWVLRRIKR